MVAFVLEKDGDVAAQEVRDKISAVMSRLPKTVQQPRIDRFDPDSAPVISIALTANKPVREVTEYADKVLRRQLESVSGVGQVLVLGGRQRQVNIWLDADRMRAYNVTVTEISRALQAQNIEVPGGRVDQGGQSLTLRTRGRVTIGAPSSTTSSCGKPRDIRSRSPTSRAWRMARPSRRRSPTSTACRPSC